MLLSRVAVVWRLPCDRYAWLASSVGRGGWGGKSGGGRWVRRVGEAKAGVVADNVRAIWWGHIAGPDH